MIVQIWPRVFDFFQLAQTVRAEVSDGEFIGRLGRVYAELPVKQRPREPQRTREVEHPVREPGVHVEAERRPLEALEDVQVERDRVLDDLLKELLAELDFALPQRGLVGVFSVPPENGGAKLDHRAANRSCFWAE